MKPVRLTRRTLMTAVTAAALLSGAPAFAAAAGSIHPALMRVEWLHRPVGIDTLRPRFTWTLDAVAAGARNLRQSAWRIVVASSQARAAAGEGDVWDSGKIEGSGFAARPRQPLPLESHRPYWWSLMVWDADDRGSTWSDPEAFTTGLTTASDWEAQWISAEADWPVRVAESRVGMSGEAHVMPIFRRSFATRGPVRHAIISVCGLGHHAVSVNGGDVGNSFLDPGWTDYRKTVLYNTYDVTDLIQEGDNVVGVMLGNGMYNVEGVSDRYKKFVGTFGAPKVIAQLTLIYEDGESETIISDGQWETRPGPIVFSSIFGGEDHDARREIAGWNAPDTASTGWTAARIAAAPEGRLKAQGIPSMTAERVYSAIRITEPKPGVFVYDFGMNGSVRPVVLLKGSAGAKVRMKPSEVLGADGLISPRSIGARPNLEVYYEYTLAGRAEETWRPRFTYCGSRYLQVEGAAPTASAVAGGVTIIRLRNEFVHANVAQTGTFESSQILLVQIHDLIKQAVLSNSASVLTDCPHREKLGWLEQTHLNAETVFYNEDAITLYEKLASDIVDAQLPSGQIPEIAPEFVQFLGPDEVYRDSPEWGGAVVLAAWKAYKFTGDSTGLATAYPAMQRYLDYMDAKRVDGLVMYGLGDWLDLGERREGGRTQLTSLGVTATATYFQMLTYMVEIARVLGRPNTESVGYRRRADEIKAVFNRTWFHADTNSYDTGSQTANAMPLAVGLAPAGTEQAILANLVADIRGRENHVTAGDVGFHYVVRALSEYGRPDVLHDMLSRTDAPSYGAQVMAGATALTENWDPSRGGSQNHFMLGHAQAWLYGGLGGVKIDMSATSGPPILIEPQHVGDLGHAAVTFASTLGLIRSSWTRVGRTVSLDLDIPAGTQALLRLPTRLQGVREGNAAAARSTGVLRAEDVEGRAALTLGSGRYQFVYPDA